MDQYVDKTDKGIGETGKSRKAVHLKSDEKRMLAKTKLTLENETVARAKKNGARISNEILEMKSQMEAMTKGISDIQGILLLQQSIRPDFADNNRTVHTHSTGAVTNQAHDREVQSQLQAEKALHELHQEEERDRNRLIKRQRKDEVMLARLNRHEKGIYTSSDEEEDDGEFNQIQANAHRKPKESSPSPSSSARRESVKVPQPQSYSGDPHEDVDEILFSFENYLSGNRIPRSRWTVHAMQLLKGKALAAYIAYAQPLQQQGITPTWEQFVSVLHTAFITHDRKMEARSALFNMVQTGSVTSYLQTFRVLISRAGSPTPCDKDLLLHYWRGLKQSMKDDSKVDPTTGAFWTSFEDLARHTITISRHTDLNTSADGYPKRRLSWKEHHDRDLTRLKLKATRLKNGGSPDPQGGRGRGSGRGGRGGRGGRDGGHGSRDGGRGTGGRFGSGRPNAKCTGHLPDGTQCMGGSGYHKAGCSLNR